MTTKPDEIDEILLTLEDVAMLLGSTREVPAATARRLAAAVRTDPRFTPHVEHLEALAREAGLPDSEDRLLDAFRCHQSLERLAAAHDWRHPAQVLDPEGDLGISYPELLRLAEHRAAQPDAPGRYAEVLQKLEAAWAEEKERAELVARFVEGLVGYEQEDAKRLLRLASSEYGLRIRGGGSETSA